MNLNQSAEGASFYKSQEGDLNVKLLVNSCISLNVEQSEKYADTSSALIMGSGEGVLIDKMSTVFSRLEVVEGARSLYAAAVEKFQGNPSVNIYHSMFEDFDAGDNKVKVVMGNHVLEHVYDPIDVLKGTQSWLESSGVAIFSVPNAESLHRRIGVELGMLERLDTLNEQDHLVGHRRVYTKKLLEEHIKESGYEICEIGGYNIKLVSQKQMKGWSDKLISAIYDVSRNCPTEICSNLYVSCRKSNN